MFAAVLFIAGIHTAVGFNIFQKPESKFTNEDPLFGPITVHSKDGVFDPTPTSGGIASNWGEHKDQLLLQEQNAMKSNSNNNNKYQANQPPFHQDPVRKKRSPQNDAITNEDEGTEIAFVLDGSGSIEQEDFERAKEFIHNVMRNVWTTCLSCKFAVVQYGRDIRTELSLNENDERLKALHKVKNIKQIHAITKTASALYYVLTDIFVPQSGSKENNKKIIILLSDGQMAGDNRTLTEVLNMPQMKGIVRYAIGLGPEVLNKQRAILEMTEIAGGEERFLKVSNYGLLKNILSSLEESILRTAERRIRDLCNS
ncbi:integrin alpha-E-like [Silurus meridionalis]|uniref:VWFA domain-containing protein n=1 Tax=Silurus meridionalis TaxID=175797 RepID=A0A8T0B118_SILME|nr:integrin alpha-E-like [Silurus meridionalis]KAF7699874.1 hypothetical protein HF521_002832 [Silurus meridionalis]